MKKFFKVSFLSLFIVSCYNLILSAETEVFNNNNESTQQQTNEQANGEINEQTQKKEQVNEETVEQGVKEVTLTDYNNILVEFFEAYNGKDNNTKDTIINRLNTCFENLCKNIKPELINIAQKKHKSIVNNLEKTEINISDINSNLYDFSYIVTQNKEDLEFTYIPLKNISLAGYSLGEKFKNKGEHIPNISNVEFLTQNDDEIIRGKYLTLKDDKEIYWISFKLKDNLKNKIIEYVNNSLSQYKNNKIFTIRKQGIDVFFGGEKDTVTTYYKGFISRKELKRDCYYRIKKDNLKSDIDNIYPIYSYPFANRNEYYFKGTKLRLVDKFENIDEYKKTLVDFLNKYKIGKKINVTEETKYLGEQIINGIKMHKFKVSKKFNQLIKGYKDVSEIISEIIEDDNDDDGLRISLKGNCEKKYDENYKIIEDDYDFYIYTDLQTKIIKIFEAVSFNDDSTVYNSMIYNNAVLDVYGIQTYYTSEMVGQKITVKNNKTTKITRIGYSNLYLFNNGLNETDKWHTIIHDDIITSFSKLEFKQTN